MIPEKTKIKLGDIKTLKRTWTVFLVDQIPSGAWGLTDFFRHCIFIPFFDKGKIEQSRIIGKQRLEQIIKHEMIHALLERILPEMKLDDKKGLLCLDDDIVEGILLLLEFWPQEQIDRITKKAWKKIQEIKKEKKWRTRL